MEIDQRQVQGTITHVVLTSGMGHCGGLAMCDNLLSSQPLPTLATENVPISFAKVGLPPAGWLQTRDVEWIEKPFHYTYLSSVFNEGVAADLLAWLETNVPWSLADGGFFISYESNLRRYITPAFIENLFTSSQMMLLEADASRILGCRVRVLPQLIVHRMDLTQGVGIHSDGPIDDEDFRLIIVLSKPSTIEDGGHLVLCSTQDGRGLASVVWRKHNSGIMIPLTAQSFHAITRIGQVPRFSLVISFKNRD